MNSTSQSSRRAALISRLTISTEGGNPTQEARTSPSFAPSFNCCIVSRHVQPQQRDQGPGADQGDAGAQVNLGVMYDHGKGVPQDYAQAAAWYRKAADQGDASRARRHTCSPSKRTPVFSTRIRKFLRPQCGRLTCRGETGATETVGFAVNVRIYSAANSDRTSGSVRWPSVRFRLAPPYSTCKPTRFPGRQKPSQFRSVSEACRGLRTEFRPFSRILRLKSPASLCPQNSVSRTTRWRGRSGG